MNKPNEKWITYAALLEETVIEMMREDGSIDVEDLANSDNAKQFLHALANVVPARIYQKLTKDRKNYLEFNHLANTLCFEYMNKE